MSTPSSSRSSRARACSSLSPGSTVPPGVRTEARKAGGRVLSEGGYEPVDSMIYYAQPGPLAPMSEERVFAAIRRVMRKAGAR